jgi:hypothetical protein
MLFLVRRFRIKMDLDYVNTQLLTLTLYTTQSLLNALSVSTSQRTKLFYMFNAKLKGNYCDVNAYY